MDFMWPHPNHGEVVVGGVGDDGYGDKVSVYGGDIVDAGPSVLPWLVPVKIAAVLRRCWWAPCLGEKEEGTCAICVFVKGCGM